MQPGKAKSVAAFIDAAVRGILSKAQTVRLCKDSPEVVTLALLAAGQRIAELEGQINGQQPSRSTPSGNRRPRGATRSCPDRIRMGLDRVGPVDPCGRRVRAQSPPPTSRLTGLIYVACVGSGVHESVAKARSINRQRGWR